MATYPHRPTRELWATGAVLAAGVAWYLAYVTVGAGSEAISFTFLPIGAFVAVTAVWRLCRQVPMDPPALRFWRLILVAFALITAGYGWLAVDMLAHWSSVTGRTMPLGSAAVVGLGFAVAMWAVARVPIGVPPAGERWRLLLDRTVAFLGCATILWHFGLAPMLTATERWSTQAMVLVGLAFLLVHRRRHQGRLPQRRAGRPGGAAPDRGDRPDRRRGRVARRPVRLRRRRAGAGDRHAGGRGPGHLGGPRPVGLGPHRAHAPPAATAGCCRTWPSPPSPCP